MHLRLAKAFHIANLNLQDEETVKELQAAEKLISDRMASFTLEQREHDVLFGIDDWAHSRAKINDTIESLRK